MTTDKGKRLMDLVESAGSDKSPRSLSDIVYDSGKEIGRCTQIESTQTGWKFKGLQTPLGTISVPLVIEKSLIPGTKPQSLAYWRTQGKCIMTSELDFWVRAACYLKRSDTRYQVMVNNIRENIFVPDSSGVIAYRSSTISLRGESPYIQHGSELPVNHPFRRIHLLGPEHGPGMYPLDKRNAPILQAITGTKDIDLIRNVITWSLNLDTSTPIELRLSGGERAIAYRVNTITDRIICIQADINPESLRHARAYYFEK